MPQFWKREEYDAITWVHTETGEGKKVFWKENCPFCIESEHEEFLVWEGKYWKIMYNKYPYSGDEKHLMAMPIEHKAFSYELSPEELTELHDVHAWIKTFYWDENYFSCTRETMANRSIEHLHIHFLPGKLQGMYLRKMLENQGFPIKEDKLEMRVVFKEGGV